MKIERVPKVFNQPGAMFVEIAEGRKFPPMKKNWQNQPLTFDEMMTRDPYHNFGLVAGGGYLGIDFDDPALMNILNTFPEIETTVWETRPGRLGMWFRCDPEEVIEALATIGKPPEHAQLLIRGGEKHLGEIKLGRTYQVIPPSWKLLDGEPRYGNTGTSPINSPEERVYYKLLCDVPPAKITLRYLLDSIAECGFVLGKPTPPAKKAAPANHVKPVVDPAPKGSILDRMATIASETGYAPAALKGELENIKAAGIGNRNNTLNIAAVKLGRYVADGALDEREVMLELIQAGIDTGLEEADCIATVRSGMSEGIACGPHEGVLTSLPDFPEPLPVDPRTKKYKVITLYSHPGEVGYDPLTQTTRRVRLIKDSEGNFTPILEHVSNCVVRLAATRTTEKGVKTLEFEGFSEGKPFFRFEATANAAVDVKQFRGKLQNVTNSSLGKIDCDIAIETSMVVKEKTCIKTPIWMDGKGFLIPGAISDPCIEFDLQPHIQAEVIDGDLDATMTCLDHALRVNKNCALLAAVILGAPMFHRWHDHTRFGIGLWGGTTTGKTSMADLLLSVFGNRYLDGPTLKSGVGGATAHGAELVFAYAGWLPMMFDNIKAVNEKDPKEAIAVVHMVLEGQTKTKGAKEGGLQDSIPYHCTPILTGESRLEESSTTARILSTFWHKDLNCDEEYWAALKDAKTLAVIGYHWLKFLKSEPAPSVENFEAFRKNRKTQMEESGNVANDRTAIYLAMLTETWEALERAPFGKVFTEHRTAFMDSIEALTVNQLVLIKEDGPADLILRAVREFRASEPGMILYDGAPRGEGRTCVARERAMFGQVSGFAIIPSALLDWMKKKGIHFQQTPSEAAAGRAMKEFGYTLGDGTRSTHSVLLNGHACRMWFFPENQFLVIDDN